MKMDAEYYYKFVNSGYKRDSITIDYDKWFHKALLVAEKMPKRGDLLLPFLYYAVIKNKLNDAVEICQKKIVGIESFCSLIQVNSILANSSLDDLAIKKSINLLNKAIDKGLFNELTYGFWFGSCEFPNERFCGHGLKGIPLSPDIIFLISDKEKERLESIIK